MFKRNLALALLLGLPSLALSSDVPSSNACVSSLLMEARSGQVLFEDNADGAWTPASVTKLMLLLLAEEALNAGRVTPETIITCSEHAQSMGGSQVFLSAGDQTSVQKLSEAVAVGSANDAAVSLAEGIFGDEPTAVKAMNGKCAALGMTRTRYVNVNGLPVNNGDPDNSTTARDQGILAREIVLRHPRILEWTGLKTTPFRPGLDLNSTNTLMKHYEGMDGLKTGYHKKGRFNLVATAERQGRRLIAVVFGAPGSKERNAEVKRLLDSGCEDWEIRTALRAGEGMGRQFPVKRTWRGKVGVHAARDLVYAVKIEDLGRVVIELERPDAIAAPFDAGQEIGRIVAKLDGKVISAVPALASRRMRASWLNWPAE